MNTGHTMNGAYAAGGTIHPGDGPALEHAAAFVLPHQLGAAPAHAAFPAASPIPVPDPTVHRLPSGHTVAIASPRILTRGHRMRLVEMSRQAADAAATGMATTNELITWLVAEWSYPFPVPAADPASLDLIPAEDDAALLELVVPPAHQLLFPKESTPDDTDDEKSPTAPSGE